MPDREPELPDVRQAPEVRARAPAPPLRSSRPALAPPWAPTARRGPELELRAQAPSRDCCPGSGVRRRGPRRMLTAERARAIRDGALAALEVASRSAGALGKRRERPWEQGGDEVRSGVWMAS